jgi:hypothetical protein
MGAPQFSITLFREFSTTADQIGEHATEDACRQQLLEPVLPTHNTGEYQPRRPLSETL